MSKNSISALRASKVSKFLNILSESDTVKHLNRQKESGTSSDEITSSAADAISDMFQSISREAMTTYEILKHMHENYTDADIKKVSDKIKILHSSLTYDITTKPKTTPKSEVGNPTNANSPFILKQNDKYFGRFNSKYRKDVMGINSPDPDVVVGIEAFGQFNKDNKAKNTQDKKMISVNSKPKSPNPIAPGLSIILHNDANFRCGSRNALELATFWNILSNIEMSKCYPFLNATFSLPKILRQKSSVTSFKTSTINQFIDGTLVPENKTDTYDFFEASIGKTLNNKSKKRETELGVDANFSIFTSPQTLNNFNENSGHLENFMSKEGNSFKSSIKNRITTPHDLTRPFMTIKSFDIDVAPSQGLMSFKTGRLSLVLHDRTRMGDIAPFIKPDLFGSFGAEITIEYGWSHIDVGDNKTSDNKNYIAEFLNDSRVVEKYIITNSSFRIDKAGLVNIDLAIAMRGPLDIRQAFIEGNSSKKVSSNQIKLDLNNLQGNLIKLQRECIRFNNDDAANNPENKSVIINGLNDSLLNFIKKTALDSFTIKVYKKDKAFNKAIKDFVNLEGKKLNKKFNKINNDDSENDLFKFSSGQEKSLINNDGINSVKKEVIKSIKSLQASIIGHIVSLRGNKKDREDIFNDLHFNVEIDAFFDKNWYVSRTGKKNATGKDKNKALKELKEGTTFDGYITFGSIINKIVATHLTNLGKFDETQVIFYTANEFCGEMSSRNIASFLISKEEYKLFLNDIFTNKNRYTIESFLGLVIKEFIEDKSQIMYGFSDLFKKKDTNSYKKVPIEKKTEDFKEKVDARLKEIYAAQAGGKKLNKSFDFKMPRVGFTFDTLTSKEDNYNRVISRLSIYDKNDNPFGSLNSIMKELNASEGVLKLNNELTKLRKEHASKSGSSLPYEFYEKSQKIIEKFTPNFIEEDPNNKGVYIIKNSSNGVASLKNKFKEMMPSITYGSQNSGIIDASLTTVNESKMNTVFLTRPDRNKVISNVLTSFDKDLPLRVLPSQASITMFGCPYLNFAQFIYLDFETGTTIDNTYSVASLKHSITPGSFKTTATLTYGDVYGKYEVAQGIISDVIKRIDDIEEPKTVEIGNNDSTKVKVASNNSSIKKTIVIRKIKREDVFDKELSIFLFSLAKEYKFNFNVNFKNSNKNKIHFEIDNNKGRKIAAKSSLNNINSNIEITSESSVTKFDFKYDAFIFKNFSNTEKLTEIPFVIKSYEINKKNKLFAIDLLQTEKNESILTNIFSHNFFLKFKNIPTSIIGSCSGSTLEIDAFYIDFTSNKHKKVLEIENGTEINFLGSIFPLINPDIDTIANPPIISYYITREIEVVNKLYFVTVEVSQDKDIVDQLKSKYESRIVINNISLNDLSRKYVNDIKKLPDDLTKVVKDTFYSKHSDKPEEEKFKIYIPVSIITNLFFQNIFEVIN